MMTPEVAAAIEEVQQTFSAHRLDVDEDGQGGARVTVHGLWLGNQYVTVTSWVGFTIGFHYPVADVYPHFVRGDLTRSDGQALGEGMSIGHSWSGVAAVQVSRRSHRWHRDVDTAAIKLTKVLEWMRSR